MVKKIITKKKNNLYEKRQTNKFISISNTVY